MRTVIGAVAAILVGLAIATGVTVTVSSLKSPDRNVDLNEPAAPNPWSAVVGYGDRAP